MEASTDKALKSILMANAVTALLALWQGWTILQLMWPFWMQSVIIGWYSRQRILELRKFSTDGLTMNDRPVPPTPESQRRVANFFALHFGGFHLAYLVLLITLSSGADAGGMATVTSDSGASSRIHVGRTQALDVVAYLALAWSFWLTHRGSHREHVAADLHGCPNLGTLMFMPYVRVVPMHLTLVLGTQLGDGAVWLFLLLKAGADVAMHKLEHHVLARSGRAEAQPR